MIFMDIYIFCTTFIFSASHP